MVAIGEVAVLLAAESQKQFDRSTMSSQIAKYRAVADITTVGSQDVPPMKFSSLSVISCTSVTTDSSPSMSRSSSRSDSEDSESSSRSLCPAPLAPPPQYPVLRGLVVTPLMQPPDGAPQVVAKLVAMGLPPTPLHAPGVAAPRLAPSSLVQPKTAPPRSWPNLQFTTGPPIMRACLAQPPLALASHRVPPPPPQHAPFTTPSVRHGSLDIPDEQPPPPPSHSAFATPGAPSTDCVMTGCLGGRHSPRAVRLTAPLALVDLLSFDPTAPVKLVIEPGQIRNGWRVSFA